MQTPESTAALDALNAMDSRIQQAEANLRILKSLNSSSVPELSSKLESAKRQREELRRAIEAEHANG